jgi:hypothetical protein
MPRTCSSLIICLWTLEVGGRGGGSVLVLVCAPTSDTHDVLLLLRPCTTSQDARQGWFGTETDHLVGSVRFGSEARLPLSAPPQQRGRGPVLLDLRPIGRLHEHECVSVSAGAAPLVDGDGVLFRHARVHLDEADPQRCRCDRQQVARQRLLPKAKRRSSSVGLSSSSSSRNGLR